MGTIFIAGVYGVGKSTLVQKLASRINTPCFSSSTIISAVNGEQYGRNKAVKDKYKNQEILVARVSELLKELDQIILTGHFCILNKQNNIENLPQSVFHNLSIDCIILLEASPERIALNLQKRDGIEYSLETIRGLSIRERTCAHQIADALRCPLIIHHMSYDNNDIQDLVTKLP